MEIGVAGREHAAVLARVKTDDLDRLVGDRQSNFSLFVEVGIIFAIALVAKNMKRGLRHVTLKQEGKRLIDVDAGLHCESQQLVSELLLAGDAPSNGRAAPVFDDGINEKGRTATKIDTDVYESVVEFRN